MNKQTVNDSLLAFLAEATTPFHAVGAMAQRLLAAGFTPWSDSSPDALTVGGKHFMVRNDSSLIAFTVGETFEDGLRLVGAHTDSPNLSVKPNPVVSRFGCHLVAVDVYGGALLNPWFDRDLSMAGKVSFETEDGHLVSRLIDFRRAIAIIPSLAIHLDREANKGRTVNPQTDMLPLVSLATGQPDFDLHALLADQVSLEYPDLKVSKILDWELSLYDTQAQATSVSIMTS
jgi:aspartyl aminopeptidase